jgi:peptide/nickel transport system permease protein
MSIVVAERRFLLPRRGASLLRALVRRERAGLVGLVLVLVFFVGAVGAPWIAPDPEQGRGVPNVAAKLQAPSLDHPLGTDELGRDLLSRVLFGARTSLSLAFAVVLIGIAIGVPIGAIGGYFGGLVDEVAMRITDMFLAFPPLLLAILIAAALGPSFTNAVIALAITWWPWYARLARGQAASLRRRAFVEAAEVIGVRRLTVVRRHLFPNLMTPIFVQGTLDLSSAILLAAGLSFLGLGVLPPTADWGQMVNSGRVYFLSFPWYATFPGLAIFLASLAFVLLGDGIRNALDPRRTRGVG